MSRPSALSLALAALGAPAPAEEATHEGSLDMVAYYQPGPDGSVVVIATFALAVHEAEPTRVAMALADGDDVSFAMPGYVQALYRLTRTGGAVTISMRMVEAVGS